MSPSHRGDPFPSILGMGYGPPFLSFVRSRSVHGKEGRTRTRNRGRLDEARRGAPSTCAGMAQWSRALQAVRRELLPWHVDAKWVVAFMGAAAMRTWQKRRWKRRLELRTVSHGKMDLERLTGTPIKTIDQFLESMGKKSLAGRWKKDFRRSDSVQPSLELFQAPWVIKKAAPFASGLEIVKTQKHFRTLVSASIIKLKESYPLDGSAVHVKRRDLRSGKHVGRVELAEIEGEEAVVLDCKWSPPLPGKCTEVYRLEPGSNGNVLLVESVLTRLDTYEQVRYTSVYSRA